MNIGFHRLNALHQNDIADVKLHFSAQLVPEEKYRIFDVLLSNFRSSRRKPNNLMQVVSNVCIQAASQIPRLDYPMVVQPLVLTVLEVRHKLYNLCFKIVRGGKPFWIGPQSIDIVMVFCRLPSTKRFQVSL